MGYFRDHDEWVHLGEFLLILFLLVGLMYLLKFFLCNLNFFLVICLFSVGFH